MSAADRGDPAHPDLAPQRRFFTRRPTVGAKAAASAVLDDAKSLLRAELELAKAEVEAGVKAKALGAALLVVAAVAGWLALQGLLITVGLALATVLPGWLAALLVTLFLLLVTGVAALIGRRRLQTRVSIEETTRNVRQDLEVARARLGGRE